MTRLGKVAPLAVTALWLGIIALGLALAARVATEPPVWDALSYVQKAFGFWRAVATRDLVNPFDLPMTLRPPGTILMSYPFGWSDDFRWFYFRSCFIPVVLFAGAVYIAGWSRRLTPAGHWVLAALALALCGMPILYQFQSNEDLLITVNWGLVDGFLGGVAAVSVAAALRSVTARSVGWALVAAIAAGFSLWIKPSGLGVMAIVGVAWLMLALSSVQWKLAALRDDAAFRRFVVFGLIGAVLMYAGAVGLAFTSEYFSADNIAFGRRALEVLETEYNSQVSLGLLGALVRASFGYMVPLLVVIGLVAAGSDRSARGAAGAALLSLVAGSWFWLGQTDATQIRYFLPFGVAAFILLVPALLRWAEAARHRATYIGAGITVLPTLAVTILLLSPSPPQSWQRAMGINLHANNFAAENRLASDLLTRLKDEGRKTAFVYLPGTPASLRNLEAVWDYAKVTRPDLPQVTAMIPTDWQHLSTVRAEDLLRCDFIAVEALRDMAARDKILAQHDVPDFSSLIQLMAAWMSTLDEADGVAVAAVTPRMKLLRITHRGQFEAALARIEHTYTLPAVYHDANPQRWWSADELTARSIQPAPSTDIVFHAPGKTDVVRSVHAIEASQTDQGFRASFWLESGPGDTEPGPWYLFVHLVDGAGNILANAQTELLSGDSPSADRPLRYYTITYPARAPGTAALAFGIFKINTPNLDFLVAEGGQRDWQDQRVIVPLPASQ